MEIQLINGQFQREDALELITQFISTKILFHEKKISKNANEEDIKASEKRIKELQHQLYEFQQFIKNNNFINLNSSITIKLN